MAKRVSVDASLRGESSHRSPVALLLIDVINPFAFEGAEELHRHALPAARRIRELRDLADEARWPVVYVNDNFGHWSSDFRATVELSRRARLGEGRIPQLLEPRDTDYFVLKPRHSGFYLTPLELLLQSLEARRIILTGFATNICVLYTAADAHMRGFEVVVPADCAAAEDEVIHRFALEEMERSCHARITTAEELARSHSLGTRARRRGG